MKYPREKILDSQNTKIFGPTNYLQEKKLTNKIPTRKISDPQNPTKKNFGPTKYPRENILDPRNTCEKKYLDPQNTHKKTFWTQETPTRKNFEPTKYPRRYDGTMALDPQEPQ